MTDKTPQPMDAGAPETDQPVQSTNHKRVAYALKTLVAEVLALFPETPHEFSDGDGRNTMLGVSFDTTVFDTEDRIAFGALLSLARDDHRVADVLADDSQVFVGLHANARIQDLRDSFDLADIWLALSDDNEGFTGPEVEEDFDGTVDVETFAEVVEEDESW